MRSVAAGFVVFFVAVSSLAQPNEQGRSVRLFDRFSISVPQEWKEGPVTSTSAEFAVPPAKPRPDVVDRETDNPKPVFVYSFDAGMLITIEHRLDHADALRRLAHIASEQEEPSELIVLSGWPAIERRHRDLMPLTGEIEPKSGNFITEFTTTAVAVADKVIRFDTMLGVYADPRLLDSALAIARSLRAPGGDSAVAQRELAIIRRDIRKPEGPRGDKRDEPQRAPGGSDDKQREKEGIAVRVQNGVGELEVAATNNGANVVVAANSGFSFSANSGATWTFGGGTPCTFAACDGDPSLTVGQSGAIYYGWLGGPNADQIGDGISRSTDNGATFPFAGTAAACPGASSCRVADQLHIAADRVNAGSGGDRVYNVWRNFTVPGSGAAFSLRIVCSSDSAANWGAQTVIGAGDFPRVSVGGDGFVYVAWAQGGNMMLHKYSNCDAGLTPQAGFPVTVSPFTTVACPVPGLDRCNGRNLLSSPVAVVDDLDPTHIYYAFATNTAALPAANEDVMVFDSVDGGLTFPRSVRVNNAVVARRFMPWISTYGGMAVVSWYDRRTATAANNDRTRFFIGGAALKGPSLVALAEVDLSGNDDDQCSTWPCATNATTDSESCSAGLGPQLAGRCSITNAACDFSDGCPAGAGTCNISRGCPKYGDYNGNAASGGIHFSAWASRVTPVGAAAGGAAGIKVFTSADRIPSDFFVRDWTTSAASHDGGQQPSTNPVFWTTSDVWNQSTSTAAAFPATDWILGDPPTRAGSNFAFARVSRRAPAQATAPPAVVTVNFLQADFGLGVPYSSFGSESVTFAAADLTRVTPGRSWTVDATASIHLCIAAQITGPEGDAFAPPTLVGLSPGPADPLVLVDNNKAQRNLQDTIGTADGVEMYAIIQNASRETRQMEIGVKLPPGAAVDANMSVVGGRQSVRVGEQQVLRIGELRPGERRRIRFQARPQSSTPVTVDFFDSGAPASASNGFTIQFARASIARVARQNILAHADVLTRIATLQKSAAVRREAANVRRFARGGTMTAAKYLAFLRARRAGLRRALEIHLRSAQGSDPFEIDSALRALSRAVEGGNASAAAAAHNALNERLDAHMTMLLRP